MDIKKYNTFFYKKTDNIFQKNLSFNIFSKLNENDPYYRYNGNIEKIKLIELVEESNVKNKKKIIDKLNENELNLQAIEFLCNLNDINVIWYNDKCCYKMIKNVNNDILYLNKYKFTDVINTDDLYELKDIDKPIRSISYYKLEELKDIYNKLKLNSNAKFKKDYYDSIFNYIYNIKF